MDKRQNGFTLIEVLVAVVILAVVIVPISTIFAGLRKNAVRTENMLQANELAAMYMEEIKAMEIRQIEDLIPEYDPSLEDLKDLELDPNEPLQNAKVFLPPLPEDKKDKFNIKVVFDDKIKITGDASVANAMDKVESDLSNADLKLVLKENSCTVNSTSFSDMHGEKTINISVNTEGEDISDKYMINISDSIDKSYSYSVPAPSLASDGENIIHIKSNGFTDKHIVNVENNTFKKIRVLISSDEEKDYDLDVNCTHGYVAIEKSVDEYTKIKEAILNVKIKVYYLEKYAKYYNVDQDKPILILDGTVTNE